MSEKLIEDVNRIVNLHLKEGDIVNFNDFKKRKEEAAKQKGRLSLYEVPAMTNEYNWKKVWSYIESNYGSTDKVSMVNHYEFTKISLDELKKSWKKDKKLLKKIDREEPRVTHIFVSSGKGGPVDGANVKILF